VAFEADYEFTEDCRYGALLAGSDQALAIAEYEHEHGTPVYYQFYNPWCLPYSRHVPIDRFVVPDEPLEFGVRVVSSERVRAALRRRAEGYRPSVTDLVGARVPDTYGWRLEDFIARELLDCREGALFDSVAQPSIDALFNRRSGPIAAAIAITVEAPGGVLD
jgi:hypothetical protein